MVPETEASDGRNRFPFSERLRFERLISEMAISFVNLPIDRIEGEIQNTLRIVSDFFEVDRTTIFKQTSPQTIEALHSYTASGIDAVAGVDVGKRYPWCWHKLQSGESVVLPSLEELPDEAATDRKHMQQMGLKSYIGIPVRIRGKFRFLFTLLCLRRPQRWYPDLLNRIQLVGQLLGNALHRKEMETELAAMAAESRQFQNELSRRDRIGTIGALTAAIAHEINQPLTAILSNAQAGLQFLARNPPPLEEIQQILADIVADDKRASEVIHNMRRLLKKTERHNERFNINDVVSNAIHMIRSEAILRGIHITEGLVRQLPPVYGDPILIQQVIINLLLNAMEAMNGFGDRKARITIRTRFDETGWIDVDVCDTGPGVPESMQNALFRKLYTSKPDGLGMGLILCRSIIESHGGTMAAGNLSDGGARFSFRLPVQDY